MISRLRGTVIEVSGISITVDIQGVGYLVKVAESFIVSQGSTVDLYIHYQWNQEQGPQLYGFTDALSKDLFVAFIGCSGCGPKIGLAILSHFKPQVCVDILLRGDVKALSEVSGIGQKKAELIIMYLKDKVAKFVSQVPLEEQSDLKAMYQLQAALEALHYKKNEISRAVEYIHKEGLEQASFDELLRKALSFLAKRL